MVCDAELKNQKKVTNVERQGGGDRRHQVSPWREGNNGAWKTKKQRGLGDKGNEWKMKENSKN